MASMSQQRSLHTILPPDSPLLPALATGLFAGRLLSEAFHPGPLGAVLLTGLALLFAWLFCRRLPKAFTWPTLPLLLYVIYPEPDPGMALAAAGLALALGWQATAVTLPSVVRALPWLLFLLAGALYVATLAPGVLPADNGELQLVSATLGVAHPPGFALYTLLGNLFSRLPLGRSPAYNVNLLSAVTGAATVAIVYLAVYRQTGRVAAGVLAAAALGTATTFWSQATTANVRSLTALFTALAIWLLLEIRQQRAAGRQPERLYALLALTLSLGIVHHASLVFMSAIFLLVVLWLDPGLLRSPRRWWRPALAGLLGLLPLLYFPLRAGADAPGANRSLATVSGFLDHVLARGFSNDFFYFRTPATLWPRLQVMGNVLSFQFYPLLLGGMALGLLLLLRRDRPLALLLGGSFALHTLVTASYRAPQTVEYMLPAYVPAVICLGMALEAEWPSGPLLYRFFPLPLNQLLAAVLLVVTLQQGIGHYASFEWLHKEDDARAYMAALLAGAPSESVLLADWHWFTPLQYVQEVEKVRPDVEVRYVFPIGEPYAVTWARQIGEAHAAGRAVVATHYDAGAYADLPPPRPLGEAFLFPQEPLTALPPGYRPLDVTFGDRIQLRGYHLEEDTVPLTHQTTLTLAWQPIANPQSPIALFTHLVGADGALYAQADERAVSQPAGLTLTRFALTPRPGATPGDYALLVGAYEANGGTPLPDEAGENRTALSGLQVSAMPLPLSTENAVYWSLVEGERRLVGYDWDNTLAGRPRLYLHWRTEDGYVTEIRDGAESGISLPAAYGPWGIPRAVTLSPEPGEHYVPLGQGIIWRGASHLPQPLSSTRQQLTTSNYFSASRPVLRDLVVSTRLIGYQADGSQWAWSDLHDSVPALGAIPTLKWIAGSRVGDPHFLEVAAQAEAGQTVGGLVTLYESFTGRTLPVLDERIRQEYPGIPLAPTVLAP